MADDPHLPPVPPVSGLIGAQVQDVRRAGEQGLVMRTWQPRGGSGWWLISLHPELGRFGRITKPGKGEGMASQFIQWLRSRIVGGRIGALSWRHPQILELRVERNAERYFLVIELNRRESNLLLLEGTGRLLIAMRHPTQPGRKLSPGQPYHPPPRLFPYPKDIPLSERYPAAETTVALELERTWQEREAHLRFVTDRSAALQGARRGLKKCARRLEHLRADHAAAEKAETWKRWGELLQIHRHRLHPGMTVLEVPDVFEPAQPQVSIPVDPTLGPAQNTERMFRRYQKLRDGAVHIARRLAETQAEMEAWATRAAALEAATTLADLQRLQQRPPAGSGGKGGIRPITASRRSSPSGEKQKPMQRVSADGYTVWAGRSSQDNEVVTFRLANGRDWWFHAQGLPGSHVVVKNPSGKALPPKTLLEAAWLAAYYSRGRTAGKVEVDYVQRKHVRKVKGGDSGEVIYSQNRSVLIDIADEELRRVLDRLPG